MSLLSFRPRKVGGVETYLRQLVAQMPDVAGADELVLVLCRDVAAMIESPGWTRVIVPLGDRAVMGQRILEAYTPWRARQIEKIFADIRADVLFFPQQSIFPFGVDAPVVLTVGDVQHLFFPENFGLFDRTFRPRVYPRSMEKARRIIAVSGFTRRTLVERCGVAPEKMKVVPHGFEPSASVSIIEPSRLVAGPYLYYPAATYAHKGHEILLRSFAVLKKRGAIHEKLVFTGQQTKLWSRKLAPLVRQLGIERDVLHLGFIPYAEVQRLYGGASAIVFPTQFEGFGMPVVEAAQFGKRILASRLEVFEEIGVPRASQIDFADPDALARALQNRRPTVLARAPLTWDECARRTLEVLRSAQARNV